MGTDNRTLTNENCSGLDLDVWGGQDTAPVLVPQSPEQCIIAQDGRCPAGCQACLDFEQEMKITGRRETGDTENASI